MSHPLTCTEMASRDTSRSLNTPVVPVILKYSYCSKEYQFISKDKSFVERYLCPICQEILCEPVQTSCGHLFCKKCLKGVQSKNCPSCRAEFEEEPRRDKFNEREIRNLIVKCQNSSRGCEWEGELGNVESHQNGVCGYQLVQCGNKCGAEMERREVEKHKKDHCELRWYECPYCLLHWDTYKKVTSEHFKECDKFPLDCPNNCGKTRIRRVDISSHLALCPEEVVPCKYQSLGCEVRLLRKQMDEHLRDKETHLDLALATTSELVAKLNKVESEHSVTKVAISNLEKQMRAVLKKTSTEVEVSPPETSETDGGPSQRHGYTPGSSQRHGYTPGPSQIYGYTPGPSQIHGYTPGLSQIYGYTPGLSQIYGYTPGSSQRHGYTPGPSQRHGYTPGSSQR